MRIRALLLAALVASACSSSKAPDSTSATSGSTPEIPIGQLPDVDGDALLAHTKTLASDAFEGRGPGTKGEDLTVEYLVDQFKTMGLEPGNTDGTYIQRVPLVGITPDGAPMVFKKGAAELRLSWRDDVVAWTKHVAPRASLNNSEVVFVGYGIVAPEFNWDDYKGMDVKGKTLLMLVNDPPVADAARPGELDPKTFGGTTMTYYGRWTYKYEIGKEKGAAGVLIVHETGPAGYPFDVVQNKVTEQFDLLTPDKNVSRVAIEGWISHDQGRKLMELAGQDFDALKKQAAMRDFKPVPLGVTASIALNNKLRTVDSRNVLAKLEGSDPKVKDEYVIYTAHWDHLGVGRAVGGDRIYNGAQDNAIGCAGLLEVARAFTKLTAPPRRSMLFLSVTAEEQGLLGSEYYAVAPVYPLTKTLANINMDGLNVHGRTKDIVLVGLGASDLDDYARAAAGEQGRIVKPDAEPEKGFYYRSDHFNFAKQGVPALDPDDGLEYVGKPADYGAKVRDDYTQHRYHSPTDVVLPDWDLSGAREDLKLFFAVGYRVAQASRFPEWKSGSEFRAKREEMLKK